VGAVHPDEFRLHEGRVPEPSEDDVLVRSLYFGYDASQRIWLTEHGGYMQPIQVGEPMRCMGIGQVLASRHPGYQVGDLVEGFLSWQDYSLARSDGPMPLRLLPKTAAYPLSWNLGVFGVGGLTAYFGITDGLKVQPGDTVVISAATGATGSLACGIAKILGAKVIGIAGGADKCRWLLENAGCDAAIDYKTEDIGQRLQALAPAGVNAYFDNVGGPMLETLLDHMAPRGRVLICGAMSSGYTDAFKNPGPRNYMLICTRMLTVRGILLFFYADQIEQAAQQLGKWVAQGQLPVSEDVVHGFEQAPRLLPTLFSGKNPGKLVLHVADPT
jgi:NADPH-dependent curcumin reductase CurA